MEPITINRDCQTFSRGGKPFFYLADTVWTAFSHPSLDEWEEFLNYRAMQGYNVIQISGLTQWDGGKPAQGIYPFPITDGRFDYTQINEEYFSHAKKILAMMEQRGMTAMIALLWCNYVPENWLSARNPDAVIPFELLEPVVSHMVDAFKKYHPLYSLGGDTAIGDGEVLRYYESMLRIVREHDPTALVTTHVGRGNCDIPPSLAAEKGLDFYLYQSGHEGDQQLAYRLGLTLSAYQPHKPVVNSEPCYEYSGFGGKYGRFSAFDVRRAIWWSLLSNANAGTAYGSQGVWMWYDGKRPFANENYGGRPLHWRDALRLPGSWDAAFAKNLFEGFGLYGLRAADLCSLPDVRAAATAGGDKFACYIPYSADVTLQFDLSTYRLIMVDLENRRFLHPSVSFQNGQSHIQQIPYNADALLIATKN
jgi:hypothetical protein